MSCRSHWLLDNVGERSKGWEEGGSQGFSGTRFQFGKIKGSGGVGGDQAVLDQSNTLNPFHSFLNGCHGKLYGEF